MRKVQVYKYEERTGETPYPTKRHKIKDGIGIFHQFGVNYEEFDSGPGNYTTAIVEMPDGSVKNVPVENIKFLD
ncbi:hypothetical protein KA005_41465 [bacterium]|nr:hypothetical protein [bacterium]